MASLGTRLHEFRKNHLEITQNVFALKCGVEQSHVSHWEKDRVKPDGDNMSKIEKAYPTLNMDWLRNGTGEMLKGDTEKIPPFNKEEKEKRRIEELEKELEAVRSKYLKALEDLQTISLRLAQGS